MRPQRRVVAGYAVFQPRITPLLPAVEEHSLYREIVTSGSGVDPYAAAASDLHQDLFGEGQFTGKGLYDLAAWDEVLRGRVPPNAVLSHDLFEGLFARCALVSDVELFEDFLALGSGGGALASLDARRLAAAAVDSRPARQSCRRWAAGRCSTTCAARCWRRSRLACWWRPSPTRCRSRWCGCWWC